MLRTKRYAQTEMCRWVEMHATIRSKEADAETKKRAKEIQGRLVHAMSQRMPMTTAAKEVWEQIGETKDQKVVRQLTILASSGDSGVHERGTQSCAYVAQTPRPVTTTCYLPLTRCVLPASLLLTDYRSLLRTTCYT